MIVLDEGIIRKTTFNRKLTCWVEFFKIEGSQGKRIPAGSPLDFPPFLSPQRVNIRDSWCCGDM